MRKYGVRNKVNICTTHQQYLIIQFSEGLNKEKTVICTMLLEESCEFCAS